jgi:hypothetical protein
MVKIIKFPQDGSPQRGDSHELSLEHWRADDEDRPGVSICVAVGEFTDPELLDHLLESDAVAVTVESLDEHEKSEHPAVRLHWSRGQEVNHNLCSVTIVCVGCEGDLLDPLLAARGGVAVRS